MQGNKAQYLQHYCLDRSIQYTRFDYRGHGQSDGLFADCGIDDWLLDALDVLDRICTGPQILIGSSMGAWIAVLAAMARTHRVAGLLTVAAAPDFTEKLIWQKIDDNTRQMLESGDVWNRPSAYDDETPYPISMRLIKSGRQHLVLGKSIPITCPVRMMHGCSDTDVPWQLSAELLDRLQCDDGRLTLIKNGDHRLSKEAELDVMAGLLGELLGKSC